MLEALLLHLLAIPVFAWQLLRAVPAEGWRHVWKRIPLFGLIWILFSLLNLLHIIGHLADEVLFRNYRRTAIREPVFIIGIPRSGTTFLQRLLGCEQKFTTFSTWEAIFAPSISEKYFYRALGWLTRPFNLIFKPIRQNLFRKMDTIHKLGLQEPEEDFLLLLPILGCFLLVFLCPDSTHYWKLGYFDKNVPTWHKKLILNFYRLCLQKHIFFHGKEKRLLSKNPSCTSWSASLLNYFPDARLIACTRSPQEAVPSQLSAMGSAMKLLGSGLLSENTRNKLIELLYNYYFELGNIQQNNRVYILPMTVLQIDLKVTLLDILNFLAFQPSSNFILSLELADENSRAYKSSHHYNPGLFSLSDKLLAEKFYDVWPLSHSASGKRQQEN